jgi:cytoskeletal protein CcmA (bactofilin family)
MGAKGMLESVIAGDLLIKGEISSSGDIEFKGIMEGDVTCRTLLISEDAKIDGNVTAEKVIVSGALEGQINGTHVSLTSSAQFKGDVVCRALLIDEEADFDGTSKRFDNLITARTTPDK